jgi:hypothetical protein
MGNTKTACTLLVGNPEGKRVLGRNVRRREGNTVLDLRGKGLEGVDCIHLARDRYRLRALVNT